MEAFHSFWSEPNKLRNDGNIRFPDYEQLTAILSALEWQKHNGRIRMVTDSCGKEYFDSIGLSSVWNGVDVYLDDLKGRIDPFLFWAAGKLYALKSMPAGSIMLDTDLIIWINVDELIADSDVTAAHPEDINDEVYPDPAGFIFKNGFRLPQEWDFTVRPANTAFLYIRDKKLRDDYIAYAKAFFINADLEGLDPVKAMCFAEQRILPMCAEAAGLKLSYLSTLDRLNEQELITHTWGFKQVMDQLPEARYQFCMRCIKRIAEEFPDKAELLLGCSELRAYYTEYQDMMK